jgi:hypothetical protein
MHWRNEQGCIDLILWIKSWPLSVPTRVPASKLPCRPPRKNIKRLQINRRLDFRQNSPHMLRSAVRLAFPDGSLPVTGNVKPVMRKTKSCLTPQNRTQHFTITKINWLMSLKAIMIGCSENQMQPINTKCNVTDCYSRTSALKVQTGNHK